MKEKPADYDRAFREYGIDVLVLPRLPKLDPAGTASLAPGASRSRQASFTLPRGVAGKRLRDLPIKLDQLL